MSLVELSNVVKRYGQHTVLNGVSLKVEKGEIIAIIGRSGSGKSTMLRCVNGLEPIQGGSVVFDGTAARLLAHEDVQEFYLGTRDRGDRRSYVDVKQYRRRRRWF